MGLWGGPALAGASMPVGWKVTTGSQKEVKADRVENKGRRREKWKNLALFQLATWTS